MGQQILRKDREYRRVRNHLVRIKKSVPAARECVIVDAHSTDLVCYDTALKDYMTVPWGDERRTIFPSRTQARKALWHICQRLIKSGFHKLRYKVEYA